MHSCVLVPFEPLNTNQQSTKSVDQQNKSCLLSSPDPLRGGAYNLQSINMHHPRGKWSVFTRLYIAIKTVLTAKGKICHAVAGKLDYTNWLDSQLYLAK